MALVSLSKQGRSISLICNVDYGAPGALSVSIMEYQVRQGSGTRLLLLASPGIALAWGTSAACRECFIGLLEGAQSLREQL